MGLFNLFSGNKNKTIQDFKERNAVILDVRTANEFSKGHIEGAKHIPLNQLNSKIETVKKWNKPIITCCQSGMRSAQAKSILQDHGIEALNGGGWASLAKKL